MTTTELWNKILTVLEEQLQKGFLEQARLVVNTKIQNHTLVLEVDDDEVFEFFNADINQQRILILSRPISSIENIKVVKI